MEIGQFELTRTKGKRFALCLMWWKDTEVLDCISPRAAAVAPGETPRLRLTFSLVHWNSALFSACSKCSSVPRADPKCRLSPQQLMAAEAAAAGRAAALGAAAEQRTTPT